MEGSVGSLETVKGAGIEFACPRGPAGFQDLNGQGIVPVFAQRSEHHAPELEPSIEPTLFLNGFFGLGGKQDHGKTSGARLHTGL
jgi:hypothetical protein